MYIALKSTSGDLIDPSTNGHGESRIESTPDDYQTMLDEINNSKTNWSYIYLFVAVFIIIDIVIICWFLYRMRI